MSSPTPNKIKWLRFACPSCKVSLRIKATYAAMRGRCPECGYRIDPLQPAPPRPAASGDGEEPGLVPVEEEWPEPAQVIDRDERGGYGMAAEPAARPASRAESPSRAEAYSFATGDAPPAVDMPVEGEVLPVLQPAGALTPREAALPDPKAVAALLPEPPPPPPPFPLWSGIYTFPWRPDNLGAWLFNALNFSLLALLVIAMIGLFRLGGVYLMGIPLVIPMVALASFWTGQYASNCFLAVVEETAGGNDRVAWPKGGGLLDGLGRFVYLMAIVAVSLIPVLFLLAASELAIPNDPMSYAGGGGRPGMTDGHHAEPAISLRWAVPLTPWLLLFPVLLLSSLTSRSPWMILDGHVVRGLVRRPKALFLLIVPPLVLMYPSLWLAQAVLLRADFALAAGAGFVWSTALLVYARLLGRAAWILTDDGARPGKKRRKKPPRGIAKPVPEAGWGGAEAEERFVALRG